jgi:hypothetical protein
MRAMKKITDETGITLVMGNTETHVEYIRKNSRVSMS